MFDSADVHAAVHQTCAAGTGRIQQFVRNGDGSVASITEALFDLGRRRVAMHHRFLVTEGDGEDAPTEVLSSVAEGDVLHLERPGEDPAWSSVPAPWPSSSPLLVLHWLLGTTTVRDARPSVSVADATVLSVELTATAVLDAAEAEDLPGVRASLDEASVSESALVPGEVVITAAGVIRSVSLALADEEDQLSLELELDELGKPYDIDVPAHGASMTVEDLVIEVVSDEAEDI